jgi:D-alanyl-D-alanine carboxypeptidase
MFRLTTRDRWGAGAVASVAIGLVVALAGPAVGRSDQTPTAAADPIAQELQAALDDLVAAGASGVTLRVDTGQRTYRLASGQSRLKPPQRMRPEAKVRVGSITKTFVSTVALQLVGEGRLSLDDTVEQWQPGLIPGGAQITVRQLLNHTSGLFNYTNALPISEVFTNPLRAYTPQELIALTNGHPLLFAPGTSWSYSNTNYIVAGLVLEQVTQQSMSQLIQQRITRPLRLRNTYLPDSSPDIQGYHARGYLPPALTGGGYLDVTRLSPTVAWAAGALVSNVDDLRRYFGALLGGRLLRPAQLAEMKDLIPVDDEYELGYGLGLYRSETACGPIWGHDGGIPGYVTIAWNDETGRRGIALGLPTDADTDEISAAADRLIDIATCRALGQEPPPAVTTRSTDRTANTWMLRIDGIIRPLAER